MAQIPTTRPEAIELAKAASVDLLAAKSNFADYLAKVGALSDYAQDADIPPALQGAAVSAYRLSEAAGADLDRLHERVLAALVEIDAEAGDIVVQSR